MCTYLSCNFLYHVIFCAYTANRVDGETLNMLEEEGSMEQFKACGLSTVMEQLKVKCLLRPAAAADANVPVAQYSPMACTGYKLIY